MKEWIQIAICDDDVYMLEIIDKLCKDSMKQRKEEYRIELFQSGNAVLEYQKDIDILFLDVEMPEIDGFEVAQELNKKDKGIKIIFLTSHEDMIQKAFEVRAYRYLFKHSMKEQIITALLSAVDEMIKEKYIYIEDKDTSSWIKSCDISCLEALGEGTAIHYKNKTVYSKEPLKYWETTLNTDFFRCHRAFLVNLLHVDRYENGKLVLKNKHQLTVSVRNRKNIKFVMREFIIRNSKII